MKWYHGSYRARRFRNNAGMSDCGLRAHLATCTKQTPEVFRRDCLSLWYCFGLECFVKIQIKAVLRYVYGGLCHEYVRLTRKFSTLLKYHSTYSILSHSWVNVMQRNWKANEKMDRLCEDWFDRIRRNILRRCRCQIQCGNGMKVISCGCVNLMFADVLSINFGKWWVTTSGFKKFKSLMVASSIRDRFISRGCLI